MRRILFLTVIALLVYAWAASASKAATFRLEDGEVCEISMSGLIVADDERRLRTAVQDLIQSQNEPVFGRPMRLCLNSPGGSLEEGARIARLVREWGIATRIKSGERCLSACSWVFMLGTTDQEWGEGDGEYSYLDREMAPSATLGFHAPLLDLGQDEYIETELAQQGYQALVTAFAEILSLSYNPLGRDIVDSDLVEFAMRTPPNSDSFYYIDTVDKAGRWNIRISGLEFPETINEYAAANACINATAWPNSLSRTILRNYVDGNSDVERVAYNSSEDVYDVTIFSGYWGASCEVSASVEPRSEHETEYANSELLNVCTEGQYTNFCSRINPISIFPGNTRLAQLSTEEGRILARSLSGSPRPSQEIRSCEVGPDQSRVRVINVNQYVNIRSGPSLQDSIVARANRGEILAIARPGFWYYETPRGRQCALLCEQFTRNAFDRSLADQVRSCIEDAQVWQQVRNGRGQAGYVSVYFLERDRQ